MYTITVKVVGTSPLMLHSNQLANPTNKYAKAIREYTQKRKKTDDDHIQIAKLELLGGLYYDPKVGVYLPGANVDAAIRDGARIIRKGTDIERGVQTQELKVPVLYEGPRDPEKLWDAGLYDIRGTGVQRATVMRCRPMFPEWGLAFALTGDEEVISPSDLRVCVELAGKRCGIGDGRKIRMGRFDIERWNGAG